MADHQAPAPEETKPKKKRHAFFKSKVLEKDSAAPHSSTAAGHTEGPLHSLLETEHSMQTFLKGKPSPDLTTYGIKLGWVQGVLIPCLLNIWGVMLFLRIAWVVAQAGLGLTILIITMSSIICVITTLSLSAICTNGKLRGGGVYYIVSRSLGAELGASVGIIFAFANAVAASMNTIGFCESLNEQLKKYGLKIIDNSTNDIRIVGAITLFVMCVICAIGMDWETKTQNFLIVTILLAIANYIIGTAIGPRSSKARAQGFVGVNIDTARQNWKSDFRYSEGQHHDFFSVFAVYFPAVTGVQAGANICGDLRDPAMAIPKGTLVALAVSISSYFTMAMLSGMGALRDASGHGAHLRNGTLDQCKPNCEYGLHNNYEIMHLMALWGPLIIAGCWAATLSTALTNLLSVPRLIQALGWDRIYPGLTFFSKPYGKHGEPYRGYVLVFLVSLLFLLIADLNRIAPLITNFYLASYALINFCTFHASFIKHISWRPTFTFYNTWLSFIGFCICLVFMVIISWIMACATVFIFFVLYLLVLYRKPLVGWSGSTHAAKYKDAISDLVNMTFMPDTASMYNPQVLVLEAPYKKPPLLDMAQLVTSQSFMILASLHEETLTRDQRLSEIRLGEKWLLSRKARGFFVSIDGLQLDKALKILIQATGLGKMKPNILMLHFKDGWARMPLVEIETFCKLIKVGFSEHLAVSILRVGDYSRPLHINAQWFAAEVSVHETQHLIASSVMFRDSEEELAPPEPSSSTVLSKTHLNASGTLITKEVSENKTTDKHGIIQNKYIDAWWFYDDGGLNILLPYIIVNRSALGKNLRIHALTKNEEEAGRKNMEQLLKRYRITYSQLSIIKGLDENPSEDTWSQFDSIVNKFKTNDESSVLTTQSELDKQRIKTKRHLRVKELLLQHSSDADIIILTLPYPREDISPCLYMTWLEILSSHLPPLLFVRGNNISVL